jgi:hypothetical protein
MTKMQSQTQPDELLPGVKFVAPAPTDEVLGGSPGLFGAMDAALE